MTSMKKMRAAALIATGISLLATGMASAQIYYTSPGGTSYSVPAGYQLYGNGVYYSPTASMYFNPVTGQYSTNPPVGPATVNSSGQYNIPSGYSSSVYGTYYSPSTGLYYDPGTGFYSSSAPLGPNYYTQSQSMTYTSPTGAIYSIPSGYQAYNSNGIYYNPSNGLYYNPRTGQYSTVGPTGSASLSSSGAYIIPSGYSSSIYGSYYNPVTGLYYDPGTGFYAASAPTGSSYAYSSMPTGVYGNTGTSSGTNGTAVPTLPNTGAGGSLPATVAMLSLIIAATVSTRFLLRAKMARD